MSEIWIKICGITRQQDALSASRMGVDAVGLVFYPPSPRALSVDALADIVTGLPDTLERVALFVDPDAEQVRRVVDTGLVTCLQFHGQESAGFCESFNLPYLKALRVGADSSVETLYEEMHEYQSARHILLDTYDSKAPGGTGKVFDWSVAAQLVELSKLSLVVAGGLTPENVGAMVRRVRPFGVDVSGGVEASPGIKDEEKMNLFVQEARSVSG